MCMLILATCVAVFWDFGINLEVDSMLEETYCTIHFFYNKNLSSEVDYKTEARMHIMSVPSMVLMKKACVNTQPQITVSKGWMLHTEVH